MKGQATGVVFYFFIPGQMNGKCQVGPVEKPLDLEQEEQNILFEEQAKR